MKIFCVGRNYSDHAKELGNAIPDEPVIFMKPKSALFSKQSPFYYPAFTNELHYECELVLKVSKNGKFIDPQHASGFYKEFSVGIDFTARDIQDKLKAKGLPWEKAKAFDNSAVVGDFISTENVNMDDINFSFYLNKELRQQGNSSRMIFNFNKIIAHISEYFSLNIGDLIFTGTPSGVGECTVADEMEAFIGGQKLLELTIQ
ncbi:fumarylacetoacetate hydrolase family protein [soil metagenome]